MNRDDVLRLAEENGVVIVGEEMIERFFRAAYAEGVADEREKSLKLWMLLDAVDTADDIAKANDAVYRNLCRDAQEKRWNILNGDEVDAAIRARGEK